MHPTKPRTPRPLRPRSPRPGGPGRRGFLNPSSRRGAQDQATRTAGTRSPPLHGTRLSRAPATQPPWRESRADRGRRRRELRHKARDARAWPFEPLVPSRRSGSGYPHSRYQSPLPARHAAQPRPCHPATVACIARACDVTWPPGPRMHSSPTCAGPRWYSGPTVRQSTEHARGSGIPLCPPLRVVECARSRAATAGQHACS